MTMTADGRDPVDVLAEEFADRLRRGEHPSVSDYAHAHPDHAEQLKELLPAVAQMEMLKRFRFAPATEPTLPDRLGDFRIVRELGRGGMGIVFEAIQESLGRPVALKVLARHAQLDGKRRERFVREAQAAAKLHHTNIVPVFGVGEQDGLPYFVMQLIHGCGLHAVVREWRKQLGKDRISDQQTTANNPGTKPDGVSFEAVSEESINAPPYGDWRFIADIGVQAAAALHYAHKQGVLHRDVKPANLIYDGEVVWVADFGLAKLTNNDGLTATGDILGTLQYLPPESLNGTPDARGDVYGLGATLYELLTLEPPYSADSPGRLIKQVADADPAPPRTFNPAIPRDLETIVLKAMAREPGARYASARELAEDLQAFLDDRPIRARRMSAAARGLRWCRRNPAVASLALSTLIALSLAAVAGWVGYAQAEERRKDAETAMRNAEAAKLEADRATTEAQQMSLRLEANLKLSLDTFEKVFEAAGGPTRQGFGIPMMPPIITGPGRGPGPGPGPGPGGHPGPGPGGNPGPGPAADSASDKAAILEAVLEFYDRFSEQNPPTPRLKFEAAKASRRVCEAHVWLDRPAKAEAAFRRAVGLLEPLVARFPDNDEMRAELVMTYAVAPREAFPGDRDAPLRRAQELAGDNASLAGAALFRIGLAREMNRDLPGAEAAYQAAVESLIAAGNDARPQPGFLELTIARYRLALVLREEKRYQSAIDVLEQMTFELRPLVEHGEGGPTPARDWLGISYALLGDLYEKSGDGRASEARANAKQYGADRFGGFGGRPFGPFGPGGIGGGGGWGGKKDGPPPKKDGRP